MRLADPLMLNRAVTLFAFLEQWPHMALSYHESTTLGTLKHVYYPRYSKDESTTPGTQSTTLGTLKLEPYHESTTLGTLKHVYYPRYSKDESTTPGTQSTTLGTLKLINFRLLKTS